MRLLFFHSSMQAGGAERTIALLSDYAVRQGDSVTIVTMDERPPFYRLNPSITQIRLACSRQSRNVFEALQNNFRTYRAIKKVYRFQQPDFVICFGPNAILLSFLARRGMKYRIIGSERTNPYLSQSGFWNKSKKWISTICDGYLFQTEGARGYYPASTQRKSIILPNGIDSFLFEGNVLPWENREHICAVGRMDDWLKCFDDLLTAFSIVREKHPSVELNIYGDGILRTELEAMSARLGLQSSVIFHGRCSTVLEEYSKHKVFVMTSQLEGLPNVLMEAMASGCACVSTNCDFGPSELIHDGENGFLVPVHDVEAIAERLCALLEDDELSHRFGEAATEIRKTHDVECIGNVFRHYLISIQQERM